MRVLFIVLLLAGCGGGEEGNNNHGYGFQYDAVGVSGMKLRSGDPGLFEALYAETEACTAFNAPPPFVILVAPKSIQDGTLNGYYWNNPSLILLDLSQGNAAKHEFIHYLLDINTGDQDRSHALHWFVDCV